LSQEDLGVAYECFVKARYLKDLRSRFGLESMLEAHCDNGGEGALVALGLKRHVVVVKGIPGVNPKWFRSSAPCEIVESELSLMPFGSRTFDLVCSLDLIEWGPSTIEYVREMGRVSRKFILIFVPNPFHVGHLIRRVRFTRNARSIRNTKSWISVGRICEALRKVGMKIVEIGGIDAPPWPSYLSVRNLARRSGFRWRWGILGNRRCPRIIWVLAEMEKAMPRWLKAFQGHIVCVLALKETYANCSIWASELRARNALRDESVGQSHFGYR